MDNQKILIMVKETNDCKIKVYCPIEKKPNAKDTVLFYLMDSYERETIAAMTK